MATEFRVVTDQAEINRFFPAGESGRGPVDLTDYLSFLGNVKPGMSFQVTPSGDENARTLKRRLTTAAKMLGIRVQYSKHLSEDDANGVVIGRALEPKEQAS